MNIKTISAQLGKTLKSYRLDSNLTQQELSEKSGVSLMTISGFESGRASVSLLTFIQLLNALNINILELFPPANLPARSRVHRIPKSPVSSPILNPQNTAIETAYHLNQTTDIEPFLFAAGYTKKHSTNRWRRFEKDNEVFLITDANTLWNVKTGKNTNLFDFIIENFPKSSPTISDTKHMIDTVSNFKFADLSKSTVQSQNPVAEPSRSAEHDKKICVDPSNLRNLRAPNIATDYRLDPLNLQNNFLLKRGISLKTLQNPLFHGAILQGNKSNQDTRYNNIIYPFKAHPAHANQQMITLLQQYGKKIEIEGKPTDKIFAAGNGKSQSLWFSNLPESPKCIYVFENPLDALSLFQIKSLSEHSRTAVTEPCRSMYCATGGNPSKKQFAIIAELCNEYKIYPVLCFDNDMAGHRFDTAFLANAHPEKLSITQAGSDFYHAKLSNLTPSETSTATKIFASMNIEILEQSPLGADEKAIVAIINSLEKATVFNNIALNFIKSNVKIEKSKKKDYNDDLLNIL